MAFRIATLTGSVPALITAAALAFAWSTQAQAASDIPGAKGAQVYCFMRTSGNGHQVSWDAAYALIKRQSASLFRTSPEHASVMITEAVVQNPDTYPDCGRFLGDMFTRPQPASAASVDSQSGAMTRSDRYGN